MRPLKYRDLVADNVEACVDELERQLLEEVEGDEDPQVARIVHQLWVQVLELRADWRDGLLSPVEAERRLREIRLRSDRFDARFERAVAAEHRRIARRCAGERRRANLRFARLADRRAQVMSRQVRRERSAHEAWLAGLRPSSERLRPSARSRDHGRPRARPRRTRGPPGGGEDSDPGDDPDHVGRRRRGRAP